MKKSQSRFLVRWFVSAFGLWVAAGLLGNESISFEGKVSAIILSGLILAIVNTIIKPLVVFMTLPAVLLSLGVFMVVINALMVLPNNNKTIKIINPNNNCRVGMILLN